MDETIADPTRPGGVIHPTLGAGAGAGEVAPVKIDEMNAQKNKLLYMIFKILIMTGVLNGFHISGGMALFLLARKIDEGTEMFNIFNGSLQKDIDFVINHGTVKNSLFKLKEILSRFGDLTEVRTEMAGAGYRSIPHISSVITMNWSVDFENSTDPMILLMKSMNGGQLPEEMKTKFSVKIDFVLCRCDPKELVKTQWVLHEYRTYAVKIDNGSIVPFKIAKIGYPKPRSGLEKKNILLNYIKNMSWKYNEDGLPGNHSGQLLPDSEFVEDDPMVGMSLIDLFLRIQKLFQGEVAPYEHCESFKSLKYDETISPEDVSKLFVEMDEKSVQRVVDHIHDESSVCIMCQCEFNKKGLEFMVLPCGCTTSVYHTHCFVKNLLKLDTLGRITSECYSCKSVFEKKL